MTSIDELTTPSNTLKAADLEGSEISLVISSYEVRDFEQTGRSGDTYIAKKPVLSFAGTEKKFVCNQTNMGAIAYVYGKEMDDWIGKEITLYPTMVSFGKEMVEAIRVRVVAKGNKTKPKFLKEKESDDGKDFHSDEIPF